MNIQKNDTTTVKGKLGEDFACEFLTRQGFAIVTRNYRKKWGEIDIIAEKSGKIYFIEVKSMFYIGKVSVSRESYRPEDNVTQAKSSKLARIIQTYLSQYKMTHIEWYFLVATVLINTEARRAKVSLIEDVVF